VLITCPGLHMNRDKNGDGDGHRGRNSDWKSLRMEMGMGMGGKEMDREGVVDKDRDGVEDGDCSWHWLHRAKKLSILNCYLKNFISYLDRNY